MKRAEKQLEVGQVLSVIRRTATYHVPDVPHLRTVTFGTRYMTQLYKNGLLEKSIFHLNLKKDVFGVFGVFTYGVKPFADIY